MFTMRDDQATLTLECQVPDLEGTRMCGPCHSSPGPCHVAAQGPAQEGCTVRSPCPMCSVRNRHEIGQNFLGKQHVCEAGREGPWRLGGDAGA